MAVVIVKSGQWLYDEKPMSVDIVGLDYDYWYEIAKADGTLDPGEQPRSLSPDGYLYYVRFRHAGEVDEPTWVASHGADSVETAIHEAERRVSSQIDWAEVK